MSDTVKVEYGKTVFDALIYALDHDLITVNEYRMKIGLNELEDGDITKYEWNKARAGSRSKMTVKSVQFLV
jgi:hypothetical protein